MYDEIWIAGKVVYKLEQVVAPGGTLIVYAPHIREISRTWGEQIEKIGYHVRDYFLAQPELFCTVPRGVLAHSTHVAGRAAMKTASRRPTSRWCWPRPSPKKPAGGSVWAIWTRRGEDR